MWGEDKLLCGAMPSQRCHRSHGADLPSQGSIVGVERVLSCSKVLEGCGVGEAEKC